jgi:collagenase-like PrtC family protease
MIYGILENRTLTSYKNLDKQGFAKLLLINSMKIEGQQHKFKEYIQDWVEVLNQNCDDDDEEQYNINNVSDEIANNLVYCNCHHYNHRTPLTSDEKTQLYDELVNIIDSKIA